MTTVYVDPRTLAIRAGPGETLRPRPGAAATVRHLADAGHRVVLVGEGPALPVARAALGGGRGTVERPAAVLPDDAAGWLVTDDPAACVAARGRRRLRTILVGPSVPDRGLAYRPSDLEERDLMGAVLAILTAEAMAEGA